jgi:TPR repeat protein
MIGLGIGLGGRGDATAAEQWLRRADDAGEARGTYNLGLLRAQRGDTTCPEHCWR